MIRSSNVKSFIVIFSSSFSAYEFRQRGVQYLEVLAETVFFFFYVRYFKFRYRKIKNLRPQKPRIMFGLTPIINLKYWKQALEEVGFVAKTIVFDVPKINQRSDFDEVFTEKYPISQSQLRNNINRYLFLLYVVDNFDLIHMSFNFSILEPCKFWKLEKAMLDYAGVKVVNSPYGSDVYLNDHIQDKSVSHCFNISLPEAYKRRAEVKRNIKYWEQNSDFIILGYMLESLSRWDCLCFNYLAIDTKVWRTKDSRRKEYNMSNGKDGKVVIGHTPNFKGIKGTRFIVDAVERLREEGFDVELLLVENRSNEEVKIILENDVDILVEQLILYGHGLSGIEGMALGLPVLSNLENGHYTKLFRRFSNLCELPIVSTSPEKVYYDIKYLVENPGARRRLGRAGGKYVERYHSYSACASFLGEVYSNLHMGLKKSFIDYFNIKSESSPFYGLDPINHGLVNNQLVKKNQTVKEMK